MRSVLQQLNRVEQTPAWTFATAARELDHFMSRLPTWRLEALLRLESDLIGVQRGPISR